MKKIAFGIIIGAILCFSLNVVADTVITSKSISYSNSKTEETTVDGALNDLFSAVDINEKIAQMQAEIDTLKNNTFTLDKTYPVGSVYISTNSTNPSSIMGGTWVAYGTGRTLVGIDTSNTSFNTVEKVGGSSTATLSTNNIPSHAHSIPSLSGTAASTGNGYSITHGSSSRTTSSNGAHTHSIYIIQTYLANNSSSAGPWTVGIPSLSTGTTSDSILSAGAHTHTVADYYATGISGVAAHTHTVSTTASTTGSNGSGTSFSVQNPYITVYMWKRTK